MGPLKTPTVCVLLATCNSARWLEPQLQSIHAQRGVSVDLVVSDDASVDNTVELLRAWSSRLNITQLPSAPARLGSANRNFVRLITEANIGDAQYVALADHDDVWLPHKLQRAVEQIDVHGLHAVSSDVIAFWADGRERPIRKSQPLRRFDYLFESAGPGCTFVLRRAAFVELRSWMQARLGDVSQAKVHDWLIYAYARSHAWKWRIDDQPLMRYRQHQHNEIGANSGWLAIKRRLDQALSGVFRMDVLRIADAVGDDSDVVRRLRRFKWRDRAWLAFHAAELRRRPRDCFVLAALLLGMRRLDEATANDRR